MNKNITKTLFLILFLTLLPLVCSANMIFPPMFSTNVIAFIPIVLIEFFAFSYFFKKVSGLWRAFFTVLLANIVSTIAGVFVEASIFSLPLSLESFMSVLVLFIIMYVCTVLIEGIVYMLFFIKRLDLVGRKNIFINSLKVNIFSYIPLFIFFMKVTIKTYYR